MTADQKQASEKFADMGEAQCKFYLARALIERDELRAKLAQIQAELDRVYVNMQELSDEVQELWLSPCEAERLKQQLAKTEAQVASVKQAVEWLWGFWDGNTLIARSSGYEEDIGAAWNKLLETSGAFSKSHKQPTEQRAKSAERLARNVAEHELVMAEDMLKVLGQRAERAEALAATLAEVYAMLSCSPERPWSKCEAQEYSNQAHYMCHSQEARELLEETLEEKAPNKISALAALVTPELAALLKRLATFAEFAADIGCGMGDTCNGCSSHGAAAQCELDEKAACALAARIRKALEESSD